MLELAILGHLTEQPLHGYELKKRLGETLGFFRGFSFGSLYPALRRLENLGAIEEVAPESSGPPFPPPTGSLSGDLAAARGRRRHRPARRTRRAYRITDEGRRHFAELLAADDGADDERSFALKLSLARFLPAEGRLDLLERRRARLRDALSQAGPPSGRHIDRYTRALLEHRRRTAEHDLAWIDELIAAERREIATATPSPARSGRAEGATA